MCQVIFSAMAAFCLAKVRFPGAKAINAIIVVALLYQSNVIYIMQYMVMAKMGMIDTYWALILPSVAAPMNLFLMRQSMTQVPDAMIEAAKVDGAGMFRICWQVVMPNQKPALMTVIIFSFQAAWNIQGGTLVFSESLKTLPTVVQQAASAGLARAGVAMAAAVFMLVPPPIPLVISTARPVSCSINSFNISPRMNCSVIGLVAIRIVFFLSLQAVVRRKKASRGSSSKSLFMVISVCVSF